MEINRDSTIKKVFDRICKQKDKGRRSNIEDTDMRNIYDRLIQMKSRYVL
jgi:hypothetical protein